MDDVSGRAGGHCGIGGDPVSEMIPPPPPATYGHLPPPPDRGSGVGPVVAALIVLTLVGIGPTLFFAAAGFGEDETATASAVSETLWLSGIALVIGGGAALVTWAVARSKPSGIRSGALAVLIVLSGAWGVVTGFLGSASISMARHPTWDDA